jgi:hypothetical protein
MTVTRRHLTVDDLAGVVGAAFAGGRELRGVRRLRGGTSKGVYRLILDDGSTCVGYVWNADENYWPVADDAGPSGLDLFEAAHAELSGVGVRVPRILLTDRGGTLVAGEVAVVEDLRGGTLAELSERDPRRAAQVLDRLGDGIARMHSHRRDRPGRPGRAGTPASASTATVGGGHGGVIERGILDRAVRDLAEAAGRDGRLAAVRDQIESTLWDRFGAVTTRSEYGLIHGELGPDHVHVDEDDEPVLVDIEGTRYFDVEWEHVFLELRFNADYPRLTLTGLDEARLSFYRLAMYLSLVAGPLRLLDGDFPDRRLMLGIVADNIRRCLAQLGPTPAGPGHGPRAAGGRSAGTGTPPVG